MSSRATAVLSRLLVAPGGRLITGRLYLRLSHGRFDPAQVMEDRGFDGPTFGPLVRVAQVYLQHVRLYGDHFAELWLEARDDMTVWQAAYYGDMSVFIASPDDHG